MLYLDTSVLVPLFLKEVHSPIVRHWFGQQDAARLHLSLWTAVEFVGALGAKVRMRALAEPDAHRLIAAFGRMRASMTMLVPAQADFELAARLTQEFASGLRAPDALHVAVARNNGAVGLVTLDNTLARAAVRFGVAAVHPS